jgi:cytochrome c5
MVKTFILVVIIISVAIACNKKAVPVITERKVDPPKIAASVYPPNPAIAPDTAMGKEVFVTRCGRCHELPKPAQFNFDRWDDILSSMVPRARLTAEQSAHITAYIKANAAK